MISLFDWKEFSLIFQTEREIRLLMLNRVKTKWKYFTRVATTESDRRTVCNLRPVP